VLDIHFIFKIKIIIVSLYFKREVYEKGKQAFVSFIRAFSKYECSHIFQIKELDLV
jgi:hypothetical protein